RWGLGGALKLQRQSLAGFSAGGLGADVGVTMRARGSEGDAPSWLDGVTAGLAIRNLWQPSLRLDRDAVPDPTTVQSGVAVRRLLGNGATLLATLDLEQPRDLDARVHAGAELRFGSIVALRAGLNRGRLTAGTGLEWQGLAVEYAFEDRDLGAQQRIGLTRAFGRTVEESRIAARDQAEREVQTRLDAAYGERQARQLDELLARAEAFRAEARFDDALDVLTTIATLAPGHAGAAALEVRCQRERAVALEAAGDATGAILAWGRVLEIAPQDSVAAGALARLRSDRERRT